MSERRADYCPTCGRLVSQRADGSLYPHNTLERGGRPCTPEQLRQIADPAERERVARAAIEAARQLVAELADVRAEAIRDLKAERKTWQAVAEVIGTSAQNAQRLAAR